jgi:hypothetical protein
MNLEISEGPDEEILERYSEEALKGAEDLATTFCMLQDTRTNSWINASVCRNG